MCTGLFNGQVQIGRFALEKENSKVINRVTIEISNESTSGRKKGAMNAEKSAPPKSEFFRGKPIFAAQMPWPSAAAAFSRRLG